MPSAAPSTSPPLQGRVALITGASRGIGREIALALARAGCAIGVAAKSVTAKPNLPGTIHSVAAEIHALGGRAIALQVDVRNDKAVKAMVEAVVRKFGRLDYLICNSGALWWKNVEDTPMSKYDLVHEVNVRGVFCCVKESLAIMKAQGFGRIVVMSPPVDLKMAGGKVAYCISKFGMTIVARGVAMEVKGSGIAINALWPCTMIESFATKNFNMLGRRDWRKASIVADAVLMLVQESEELSGNALIDEDYLRTKGVTDFSKYQCVQGYEPKKVWPLPNNEELANWNPVNAKTVPKSIAARL